jgi:hypothetical protein
MLSFLCNCTGTNQVVYLPLTNAGIIMIDIDTNITGAFTGGMVVCNPATGCSAPAASTLHGVTISDTLPTSVITAYNAVISNTQISTGPVITYMMPIPNASSQPIYIHMTLITSTGRSTKLTTDNPATATTAA